VKQDELDKKTTGKNAGHDTLREGAQTRGGGELIKSKKHLQQKPRAGTDSSQNRCGGGSHWLRFTNKTHNKKTRGKATLQHWGKRQGTKKQR